jgi:hypothetical protein
MEEIKAPKKERKFLKAVGNIGKVLAEELVMGIARKFIGKVVDKVKFPKKRQTLSLLLLLSCSIAFAQFPSTGNKQRLGYQTTADGLVWRGSLSDTASIQPTTNQNAWLIIDTINLKIYSFDFTSNVWGLVGGGGGLTMPFDSITFNTAKDGTVGLGEVEYNDTQGSLIQGLKGGLVTNVIGQQLHQRVNNRTGATLSKGTAVYLSGSQGNRITVAKALGVTDAFSANTFGIVAESIANNQSGYVITEGLITNINTSALVEDSAVYLSPTVAGGLTSTKPQAPQHTVYIGVCVKSNAGSGELFVKIRNGQELNELHDVRISNPLNNASLYYKSSEGIWRDTTATLLVSDTATMLANYATKAYADTSGRFYARQDFTNVSSSTLTWTQSDTLVVGGTGVVQVYRNGQILLPTQYTIPTNASVVIGATAYKVGENYTVIFPRGGGGGGSGSGSLTSISAGTGITVNPNPITTTGTVSADLSVLMELTDTSLLNLTTRFATKLNATDTASLSNRINAKGTGTVTSIGSGFGLLGGTITTTGNLRLDTTTIYARLQDSINVAIGGDTIKILKQEYNAASSSVLTWTITPKFPIQLKAYILVFRNGQLLNNDQYNLTDTNKITIVSTSFKVGANYTVATVSGIGSVGSAQAGNPVYPEAGIALSTGTTWASSIPNNSSNWNTAFTDRLKWDGGSTGLVAATGLTSLGGTTIGQSMFTLTNPSAITFPQFNADNSVTTLSAASFRSAIGAGTVTSVIASTTAGNPISITNTTTTPTIELLSATSARNGYLTSTDWTTFNSKQAALGFTPANSTITIGTTAPLQGGGNLTANRTLSITQATTSADGFLTSTDWNTFNAKQNTLVSGTTIKTVNSTTLLGSGNLSVGTLIGADTVSLSNRINLKVNISDTSAMLLPYLKKVDTTSMLLPYFRDADTSLLNLTNRFNTKLNISDTLNMLSKYLRRADTTLMLLPYLRKADTTSMLLPYFRDNDTTLLNLSSRFNTKVNLSDTLNMLTPYLRKADTTSMLLPYFRDTDTTSLNLTNRFNAKLNLSDTTNMLTPYLRDADTTSMLLPYLRDADTTAMLANYRTGINAKVNISDTLSMLTPYLRRADTTSMLLPYFRDTDTISLNLTSRFAAKQNTLVSGTTIKTVNGTTLLGSGNLSVGTLVATDTASLSNRINLKFNTADTTQLNLTSRFATKLNYTDTSFLFTQSDTSQLNLTTRFAAKQNTLTNPITGTGTINYIPKFTSTGSTIGNSTLIDNGTTVSTSSILSTTNYASFNTSEVMGSSSGMLSTHRFTSANANGIYNKNFFLTSYMGAPWQGSDLGNGNRSKPPIVAIINNNDSSFINSGLHLMTTNSTNNTYTPALTFGVNSENGSYYNTIGAITAKKLNTGQFTSLSTGQLEFFGTGTLLDATGASMTTANMTLGVGVGIGYTTAPTIRGRLIVSEKIGINNDSPTNTLDVSGTFRATGAATLSSTLAVQGDITENGNNVLTSADTTTMLNPYWRSDKYSGTLPIANGGTGAESASVARTTLAVGYLFIEVTAGTNVIIGSNRVSLVNTGGFSTTQLDLTNATNGRMYMIKNLASGTVISDASNVIPFNGGSPGTAILGAGNVTPQWCTLVADGTNWHIMQRN